jgi:hypothetical protein
LYTKDHNIYSMNFLSNINITDALTVWDGVKDSMKTINVKPKDNTGIDFSFITPTLLGILAPL